MLTGVLHEEALESFASLKQQFEHASGEFGAECQRETLELNAIRAERFDMRVVDEIDAVKVDHAQIGHGRLQLVNIDHLCE